MTNRSSLTRALNLPLVLGLGAFALVRPLVRIVQDQSDLGEHRLVPVALTVLVTTVWVLAVALSRQARPVATLVAAGLTYAVLVVPLSALTSVLLLGDLEGPLTRPWSIVPLLIVNALWGACAGVLALALQRFRG